MPSRLSSLLVRDGLVSVKRMERAFQRQVIFGGNLDTVLLEMNLVPEERLVQYLSLATGVPPATRAETDVFDAEAVKVLPEALAMQFGVAPLSYDGDTLRVAVKEPVDFGVLEECADALGLPIQPLVVPEYRFHVLFDRAYGRETDARFAALAARAAEAGPTPVGKPKTVIVEDPGLAGDGDVEVVDVPLPPSSRSTLIMHRVTVSDGDGAAPDDVAASRGGEGESPPGDAEPGEIETAVELEAEPPAAGELSTGVPEPIADAGSAEATQPREQLVRGEIEVRAPSVEPPGPPSSKVKIAPPAAVTDRHAAVPPPAAIGLADPSPLSVSDALAALAAADDRDAVFSALLRGVRSRTWYAGLLTVQGGVAIGRVAIAGSEIDADAIAQVIVPLDVPSAFQSAVRSGAPYIGPIVSGHPDVDGMLVRMGGVKPPTALLLPIALRNRVVALVVGHRGADAVSVAEVSEVLPLAAAAADAISRLILRAKKVGYRPARDESAPHIRPERVQEAVAVRDRARAAGGWTVPAADAPRPQVDVRDAAARAVRPISELLDAIERDDDPGGDVTAEILRRAGEAVAVLAERFPGRLDIDRYELGGRPLRAERYGPLLGLVVKLGTAASPMLIEKMRDPNRDVRYYATLCVAELRPRSALRELVERLFDSDYGVRTVAIEALRGYPIRELEAALEGARRALHADDRARVQAAAYALGELSDVRAIPDLLDALSRGGQIAQAVQAALVALTRHDFGTNPRKWRAWWNKNATRPRIEWLLDALSHKSAALREGAVEELRRLTGEYFGYHHDLPKREREAARRRWIQWWNETGRRRFLREADESGRPTGVLPARES
ncbi:MAG: hypothetical protein D6689_09815 [Deltaproteobacteria bacterium]|nr:MAG: hypothetical protein D6689_09815 [Deltaproteobacteria bacterium]